MNAPASDGEARSMAGRQLGRYEILTELASGGMASVYIARAQGVAGFERLVAIKVLHPHLAYEEEFISMFLDEARLAARIRHMNVVPTIDISDSHGDGYFLVMDYIEGHHLGALLGSAAKKGERLPARFICRVLVDALQGLAAAHGLTDEKGVPLQLVHRDVSPHNILVGTDGIGRLTDFGVAKAEVRMASTRAGQFKGKLSYMAPEQASTGATDQRSDLFSMGVILWESLTGRRLFKGESNAATLNKLLRDPIPKPSDLWKDLAPFDEVSMKALGREPDDRFQTADEFMEALENAAEDQGVASARAVAKIVRELAGDKIDQESERVREAIEHLGQAKIGQAQMPAARAEAATMPGETYSRGGTGTGSVSGAQVTVTGVLADGTPIFVRPSSDSGLLKWTVVALAALVVVYAGFLGWQFMERSKAVAPAKQIAPPGAATAEERPAGAAPAALGPASVATTATGPAPEPKNEVRPDQTDENTTPDREPKAEGKAASRTTEASASLQKTEQTPRKKRRVRRSKADAGTVETTEKPEPLAQAATQAAPIPAPAPTPTPEPVDIEIDNPYRH